MSKNYAMLICTDAKKNNNKFYELTLNEDDTVLTRWGRVGSKGSTKILLGGEKEFNRVIRAKERKNYERTQTVSVRSHKTISKIELATVAKRDMLVINEKNEFKKESNEVLIKLIDKLTEINRHQLVQATAGNININEDGLVSTPLGLVTEQTVAQARDILNDIEYYVSKQNYDSSKYINKLESYLKLVPQKVPARRGWHKDFFNGFSSLIAQGQMLDQLEGSVKLYEDKIKQVHKEENKEKAIEKVFDTKLNVVTNQEVIDSIRKMFEQSKNGRHESSKLKLKNVFELTNQTQQEVFNKRAREIGNVQRLWHGTRAFNVLSILKSGLIIPKSGGSYQITGRMYGDGLYFSDQSTKSLNYSYGYWDRSSRDHNCFMFVADVAMGKMFIPQGYRSYCGNFDPKLKKVDSLFAKGDVSGVINNEMIVYALDQVCLKYLCEFGE